MEGNVHSSAGLANAGSRRREIRRGRAPWLLAVGIVGAALVGLAIWLVVGSGDGENATTRATPRAVSIRRLDQFASSGGRALYWAGPQARATYELTSTNDGRVYVRYLPPGVKVGDRAAKYLTIGTYPQQAAFATLKATARKQRVATIRPPGGGLAFQDKRHPTSVYVSYPGAAYQIEVYDPSPTLARRLVLSGQISAVGTPPHGGPASRLASAHQLSALAVSLGHPIYWAGIDPKRSYEVTKTRDGRVYVRYLPQGVRPGDRRPDFLTVGTYPLANAGRLVKATARKNGVPIIHVPGGGVAFADKKHPSSVYIAYPTSALEIEVYAPTSGRALQLVASGQIAPVR
jgi:hypothetical protein